MASILFASVPIHGHVSPLLPLAQAFVARGDRVRFLTGARFRDAVTATGAEHIPLPDGADFDDRDISASFPARAELSPVKAIAHDIEHVFIRPGAAQYAAIRTLQADAAIDALIVDPTFAAAAVLLELSTDARPPIVVAGVLPLNLPSTQLAPFGFGLPPRAGITGRVRNHVLNALARRLLASANRAGEEVMRTIHDRAPRHPVMEWMPRADALVQLTVPSFEYPRPDTTANLQFVGPVSVSGARQHALPAWWNDLDGPRPVIHVTQGTLANDDLDELILPTIAAFADRDVLVVVATGGVPVSRLGDLPGNVRAAEFLPYDELMPRAAVVISNGGYGGAQFALRHGVPLVVAPGKEDKVEVAARIAWSGAGVNLRTPRPGPAQLRRGVDRVLADPSFRAAAQRIGADMAAAPGTSGFLRAVDGAVSRHRADAPLAEQGAPHPRKLTVSQKEIDARPKGFEPLTS